MAPEGNRAYFGEPMPIYTCPMHPQIERERDACEW
jgi:hypothetical protein